MSADLKKLRHTDTLLIELQNLKANNFLFNVQNSIIVNRNSLTNFAVFIPLYKNNDYEKILVYEKFNEQFLFYIVSKSYVKNIILYPNDASSTEINKIILLASGINILHFRNTNSLDTFYNNFIKTSIRDSLIVRDISNRGCYSFEYPIHTLETWFNYDTNTENVRWYYTYYTYIWCDELVLPEVIHSSPGSGGGGGTNLDVPPSTMIDLDCWRNGLTASVKSQIYEILESYINPCDPESINNIINNIMIEACTERSENGSGTDNSFLETLEDAVFGQSILDRIYSELEGVDKIIIDPSFKNCKNLKCVFEYLELSGSKMFCNNIYKFGTSDKINLTIRVENFYSPGSTEMDKNGGGVLIKFEDRLCNSTDYLYIAETILHESQHAAFRYKLASNNDTQAEYKAKFLKWVNEQYGVIYTEDQLMIYTYMEICAEELWILNGKKFDKSYYMAWVWEGLDFYLPNAFPMSKIQEWNSKRDLVNLNSPFQCH
ncbi:MAG: hypothetical protein IPH36_22130 [Saprospiraceae bacterium]|nr:hypothetical protein [Saprospiraceae bacterium]MBK7790865.1 hypothetical protein [Saprospiraceae bacterium]